MQGMSRVSPPGLGSSRLALTTRTGQRLEDHPIILGVASRLQNVGKAVSYIRRRRAAGVDDNDKRMTQSDANPAAQRKVGV